MAYIFRVMKFNDYTPLTSQAEKIGMLPELVETWIPFILPYEEKV